MKKYQIIFRKAGKCFLCKKSHVKFCGFCEKIGNETTRAKALSVAKKTLAERNYKGYCDILETQK